ncbi:MAG: prolyl oligopeptidase family serine peptidase [Candidatus Zhuqueibacterota bacterium]
MKRLCSLLAIHLFIFSLSQIVSFAQENVVTLATCSITQTAPTYSQPLFSVDAIEEMLVTGQWVAPTEEMNHGVDTDSSLHWIPKSIDERGWFNDDALHGGYAFFSVDMDTDQIVLLEGMGHDMVYINGVPHGGNRYQNKEQFELWEPNFNFSLIPVHLNQGKNELVFQCSRGRLKVKLHHIGESILFNSKDRTLPDLMAGESIDTWGAIVVVNATHHPLKNYLLACSLENGLFGETPVPIIQPMSTRKIGFRIQGKASAEPGEEKVELKLFNPNNSDKTTSARCTLSLNRVSPLQTHKRTFISSIDGSVQYFAVNPARAAGSEPAALFLSAHGASVEAINQANAYEGKSWGHIVAPTNRRPFGFNWEDWGRLDAMEVLGIAAETLQIDPARIYLTGHSMGGHGAWHLGVTFPDQFAAIGPSAGWISFWSYRIRESLTPISPMTKMLNRATSPSNTFALAENLKPIGVYILHGAVDDNVPADQARQMSDSLSTFHKDFIYHEEPGVSHWWDNSDEPGTDCVDWAPMFDFFAHHARPQNDMVREIEFITANPGISAKNYWLTIEAQQRQLEFSSARIQLYPGKRQFIGTTSNIARMTLDVSFLEPNRSVAVNLDGQDIATIAWPAQSKKIVLVNRANAWSVSAESSRSEKGPHRYGTFKDAFKNRFVFVYSTQGAEAENQWAFNKARFDAEQFWYQGNGSVDILSDMEFDPAQDTDRNVILYGNATTNAAWNKVLDKSEVEMSAGRMKLGDHVFKGDDVACLMIRPRKGSDIASVGIVGGTGIKGMKLTNARRYLFPGYAFPDCVIFSTDIFEKRIDGVLAAGFFGLDWSVKNGDFVAR